MDHSFNIEHAKKYGILEAILLKNLVFWIQKNRANEKHLHDERYWTYNSITAWSELFPYASESQIRRSLDKLVSEGILMKGKYNSNPFDHSNWYAFVEQNDWIGLTERFDESIKSDLTNSSNRLDGSIKTITDNKQTDSNTDNKQTDKEVDFIQSDSLKALKLIQDKGLIEAYKEKAPSSYQRLCMQNGADKIDTILNEWETYNIDKSFQSVEQLINSAGYFIRNGLKAKEEKEKKVSPKKENQHPEEYDQAWIDKQYRDLYGEDAHKYQPPKPF